MYSFEYNQMVVNMLSPLFSPFTVCAVLSARSNPFKGCYGSVIECAVQFMELLRLLRKPPYIGGLRESRDVVL